jgi:hypothetical protein
MTAGNESSLFAVNAERSRHSSASLGMTAGME